MSATDDDVTAARLREWYAIQAAISDCAQCPARYRAQVTRPLAMGEIPDPPGMIDILFVGVAPTAQQGRYKGAHFYSSSGDLLRLGLFKLLSLHEFGLPLEGCDLKSGNDIFHGAGCFFVHAAKIRPIAAAAPSADVIKDCARRHLREEISLLRPRAICFLGTNNASIAARALFGRALRQEVQEVTIDAWTGLATVTDQPRRGWERRTLEALRMLWRATKG